MKKILGVVGLVALVGCIDRVDSGDDPGRRRGPNPRPEVRGQLEPFADEEEFRQFLAALQDGSMGEMAGEGPVEADAEGPTAANDGAAESDSNEEITNNQESGVDEGGIVKNYEDLLLILRQGRLVVVRVGEDGRMARVGQTDVTPPGLGSDVWYDELLVEENRIVVVGYRYGVVSYSGATEINLFEIGEDDGLTRLGTYFIESNDYYSGQNYASRLVGGQLVLYTPGSPNFWFDGREDLRIPRLFRYEVARGPVEVGPIVRPSDVFRPIQDSDWPTLHTILTCDLTSPEPLDCHGKVIVAPWSRELYVSPSRAYLWVADEMDWWTCPIVDYDSLTVEEGDPCGGESPAPAERQTGIVYALALDGSESGAVEVTGAPANQFSFSESDDRLDLVVEDHLVGSWTALVQIPFADFDRLPAPVEDSRYLPLDNDLGVLRFTDSHLVAHDPDGWLLTVDRRSRQKTHLPFEGSVSRIELAGERVVVAASDGQGLTFSVLALGEDPAITGTSRLAGMFEGEWRSHGYAFHRGEAFDTFGIATVSYIELHGDPIPELDDDAEDGYDEDEAAADEEDDLEAGAEEGVTGNDTGDVWWWYEVSASVHFFNIDESGQIALAGVMEQQRFREPSQACTASCVDWYGNSRPIFLGDQVLGLIGDQISSGFLDLSGALVVGNHLNILTGEVL